MSIQTQTEEIQVKVFQIWRHGLLLYVAIFERVKDRHSFIYLQSNGSNARVQVLQSEDLKHVLMIYGRDASISCFEISSGINVRNMKTAYFVVSPPSKGSGTQGLAPRKGTCILPKFRK